MKSFCCIDFDPFFRLHMLNLSHRKPQRGSCFSHFDVTLETKMAPFSSCGSQCSSTLRSATGGRDLNKSIYHDCINKKS